MKCIRVEQITHMGISIIIHYVEIPTVRQSTRMHCNHQKPDNIYCQSYVCKVKIYDEKPDLKGFARVKTT